MRSSSRIFFTAAPLATLTAVGMLATDLYLPAVPDLPRALGGSIAESQWTLASFMGSLAVSQLLWGWASDRHGERRVLNVGMFLLLSASVLCALSASIGVLILGRALQGLGAGAATTVVPVLLKKRFPEADAVRAIAIVGSAESLAPALGPVAGAVLISRFDWRASFWAIAAMTAALVPVIAWLTREEVRAPPHHGTLLANLLTLLRDLPFVRISLSYSLMFAALIMVVASAPQIITGSFGLPVGYFSAFQVCGVAIFILAASQGGRLIEQLGTPRVLLIGSRLQFLATSLFVILSFVKASGEHRFFGLAFGWCVFGAGLGLRGPATFSGALSCAGSRAGQAAGLLMFTAFGLTSLATAAVGPFLVHGLLPLSLGALGLTLASVACDFRMRTPHSRATK